MKKSKFSKLHKCPECGRPHTGFTGVCGDCSRESFRNDPAYGRTVSVTKLGSLTTNNVTPVTKSTTPSRPITRKHKNLDEVEAAIKKRGRPRKHKDNAARQKAWRGR